MKFATSITSLLIVVSSSFLVSAFQVSTPHLHRSVQAPSSSKTTLSAFWRSNDNVDNESVSPVAMTSALAASFLVLLSSAALPANAVSGGGKDYANLDITGQDFANQNYRGKDFSQVIAKGTEFMNSNLQGCRFYKAYLVNADFSGADLRGASVEDTSMDGAILKGTNAAGAYFGQSLLDVGTLENADFTDAQIPMKILPQICEREDAKGTNAITGADTRDSLMCP